MAELQVLEMITAKAGGVGIELTPANTAITSDRYWNLRTDLQAQAGHHWIAQTKAVKVYRLLSACTYEKQMFDLASMKKGLDQTILNGPKNGAQGSLPKEEAKILLNQGAYAILNEEADKDNILQVNTNEEESKNTTTVGSVPGDGTHSGAACLSGQSETGSVTAELQQEVTTKTSTPPHLAKNAPRATTEAVRLCFANNSVAHPNLMHFW